MRSPVGHEPTVRVVVRAMERVDPGVLEDSIERVDVAEDVSYLGYDPGEDGDVQPLSGEGCKTAARRSIVASTAQEKSDGVGQRRG